MIRSGLGREVAITPLKSLWTFLSVGLDSFSFGREGKAQALGLGVDRREESRLVGKWGGTVMEADCLQKRIWKLRMDTGNLLRVTLVEGDGPAVSDSKAQALLAPLAPRDSKSSFVQRGREEEFSLPPKLTDKSPSVWKTIKYSSLQARKINGHYSNKIYENHK